MADTPSGSEDESSSDSFTDESSQYSDDKEDHQESNDESSKESDGKDKNKIRFEDIKTYFRVNLMYNKKNPAWPRTTYLHYTLKLSSSKVSKANKRIMRDRLFNSTEHAEITLLKILQKELALFLPDETTYVMYQLALESKSHHTSSRKDKKMLNMYLKIVMNYSPCKACADEIEKFMKDFEHIYKIDISITFGSFFLFYPKDDKNKHIEGLAKLQTAGIELRLVWDSRSLKEIIETIGTEEERKEREKKDREYMELVDIEYTKLKAKEIAADNSIQIDIEVSVTGNLCLLCI